MSNAWKCCHKSKKAIASIVDAMNPSFQNAANAGTMNKVSTTPDRYHTLCAESFIAETHSHIALELHFQTCPECQRLLPDHCPVAQKIIEQSIETKEKT